MQTIILMPAYGRVYEIHEQAEADWINGKDFRIQGTSSYCSIRDVETLKRHHENVMLHARDGGIFVVRQLRKLNKLDGII